MNPFIFTPTAYLSLVFLLGSGILASLATAAHRMGKLATEEALKKKHPLTFFRKPLALFFKKQLWEGLLFTISLTKHLLRIAYALLALFFLISLRDTTPFPDLPSLLLIALYIFILSWLVDFAFCVLSQAKPHASMRLFSPLGAFFIWLCLPFTALFLYIMRCVLHKYSKIRPFPAGFKIRDKVYELLQETELGAYLDDTEQKFILSTVSFKERIAREVMVPRINVFSLPETTSILEAARAFSKEGYSRIPIYRESVDNIIGVLLYKDVLKFCLEKEASKTLQTPIRPLVKSALYTPETKKISALLQEFRSKQIHLAIVVDEWGGTEGIVTIEDILEELVGEIADEYDVDTQDLFTALPGGGWVIDAKMSIIDIQEELGVDIPQSPEYDTIGGYVFYTAGSIPFNGWKIHHDAFELEVVKSTERAVDKIKIIPHELS